MDHAYMWCGGGNLLSQRGQRTSIGPIEVLAPPSQRLVQPYRLQAARHRQQHASGSHSWQVWQVWQVFGKMFTGPSRPKFCL